MTGGKSALRSFFFGVLSAGALGSLLACKSSPRPAGLGDDVPITGGNTATCVDHDGDGYGRNCALGLDCNDDDPAVTNQCYACLHAEPGCPCTSEGAKTPCGTVTSQSTSSTICSYGDSTCTAGTWGTCVPNGKMVRAFSTAATARKVLGLAGATACLENICDPYCLQFADTPDGTLSGNGILGTSNGLTLVTGDGGVEPSSGSIPPDIRNVLDNAGLAPSAGSPVIFHELPLNVTATDTVSGQGTNGADVYFLDYTIGRVTGELRDVMDFAHDGGIADRIQRQVADVQFGAGHYEQYNASPWNASGVATIPYEHVLSMTPDRDALGNAVTWLDQQLVDTFPLPRSWAPALFALSTTGGLRASTGYVVPPRWAWSTPLGGETDSCSAGTRGYPCFRPGRTPITVLLADAPSNNGPGGQHAYERDAVCLDGAKNWSGVTPTPVAGNGSESTARTIDVTTFAAYTGNTNASGNANQTWAWSDFDDCHQGSFRAKNVFFKFHAADRTWFHFDTYGSRYNTVLYLYKSGGPGIACNVISLLDMSSPNHTSSIDGVVDPGDYFLVVDGRSGDSGDYVLHVNAMPDGAASGSVAAPNYDESIAAYNALGGKVVGVDWSGFACHDGPNSFVESNTGNALEKVARDTNSFDATGQPLVVHLDPWGPPCLSGDDPPETQIVNAVVGLANRRADITLAAVDVDDAIDFDGPPGGATQLTPMNVDDATFLASTAAIATPEAVAGCQQILPDRFVGCAPGTKVGFRATFARPAAVPALPGEQIFTFALRVLADGASVLSETPVVLVIPPPAPYHEAWFVRDYDAGSVCPAGTAPTWGTWSWTASTPGDSRIDFEVAVAGASSDLGSSPFDPLEFTDPPGPTELQGQFIGALAGAPDTQQGGALVDTTLFHHDRPRDARFMRLRAHLIPSANLALAPTLETWNLAISCRPAE